MTAPEDIDDLISKTNFLKLSTPLVAGSTPLTPLLTLFCHRSSAKGGPDGSPPWCFGSRICRSGLPCRLQPWGKTSSSQTQNRWGHGYVSAVFGPLYMISEMFPSTALYIKISFIHWILAENGGGAEKKPKVEVGEDDLKAHVQNGTLGKLTVPVLKEACKLFGVKTTGTKKQDLIDALTAKLGSWRGKSKLNCAFV